MPFILFVQSEFRYALSDKITKGREKIDRGFVAIRKSAMSELVETKKFQKESTNISEKLARSR